MIIRIRFDVMKYHLAILLVFLTCEGTDFDCTQTDTIYTRTGNSAVFFADATVVHYFHQLDFYNTTNGVSETIFEAFVASDLIHIDVIHVSGPFEHRITVHGNGRMFENMNITIALKNIKVTDNGTYALKFDGWNSYCWTLFVLDIRSQNEGKLIPEGSAAIFEGLPQVSLGNTLALDATFTWLLQGLHANQTTRMHVQGDMMWMPNVTRDMEGWNVTYRCAEDTGEVVELNKTLRVMYIRSQNEGKLIPEGSTAIFEGLPQVSLGNTLALDATFTWLLQGLHANQTTRMHVQGDMMWMPNVTRDMEGWNITYRCAEDTGEVVELNKTLRLMYMKVPKQNQLIEEGSTIFFHGYPPRQTYTNQGLQIVWLFDGYNLTQTSPYQFLEQGDKLWIPYVSRVMNGKYVTYRSIENTGIENEINAAVRVSYGPNWPIHLSPTRKTYQERVGAIVPEIKCYVDCSPACNLSWGIHSGDNILKLERITKETEGEYTCTARRKGTDTVVIETIYVYVQEEDRLFTVPIAVLAGVQVFSMCCILFLLVCVLRNKKKKFWRFCCQVCLDKVKRKQTNASTEGKPQSNECQMSTLSNEAYEDLRPETREAEMENYNDFEISEVYVNTTLDAN